MQTNIARIDRATAYDLLMRHAVIGATQRGMTDLRAESGYVRTASARDFRAALLDPERTATIGIEWRGLSIDLTLYDAAGQPVGWADLEREPVNPAPPDPWLRPVMSRRAADGSLEVVDLATGRGLSILIAPDDLDAGEGAL